MLFITGCSNKIFKPIYTDAPTLTKAPVVTYLQKKAVPNRERKQLVITLSEVNKPKEDNYFNNLKKDELSGDKRPSVIIAVPEEVGEGTKKKEFEESDNFDKIFGTSGYYNEAEQAIEKSLLRIGFDVLDRSKFEAKLRDLRDRGQERPWFWNDWTEKYLENGEFDIVKDEYKKQLQDGTISIQQYTEIITEVDKISQRGLPGKKRDEDEMNDIAEVIRAAQTGTDQAEYLLQINEVSVADAGSRSLNITKFPEVKQFLSKNEGLSFGKSKGTLPTTINSNWLRSEFNAKLREINRGSIVCLGSHELESWSAEEITISFDVQKYVDNEEAINGKIMQHNNYLRGLVTKVESINKQLNALYLEASTKRKFKNSAELKEYSSSIKSKIKTLEAEYEEKLSTLNSSINLAPIQSENPWTYSYLVSSPIVEPNLLDEGKQNIQGQQRLLRHRKELINAVTNGLIKTIAISK